MATALTYRMEGDYSLPNLSVPAEPPIALGKYALLRKKYLKQHCRVLYVDLLTAGALNEHLMEVERAANERMGLMNNFRHSAEEAVLQDLVYA